MKLRTGWLENMSLKCYIVRVRGLNALLTRYNNCFLDTTVSWLSLRVSPLMTNAGLSRIMNRQIIIIIIKVNRYRLVRCESNECLGGKFTS